MFNQLAGYLGMPPELLQTILAGLTGIISLAFSIALVRVQNQGKERDERVKNAETELEQVKRSFGTVEQSLILLGQFQQRYAEADERHAKSDERNAENDRKQIEVQTHLATAIEALTAASTRSQSFVEKRSDDTLLEIGVVSERTADLQRTGNETLSKVDLLASGLEDVKAKLDQVLTATQQNPNKAALEQIEKAVNELLSLAKAPKPIEVVVTPAISVPNDDTLPLDETTLNQVNEEKKEDAA